MDIKLKTNINPNDDTNTIIKKILESRGITTESQQRNFMYPEKPTLERLQASLNISNSSLESFKNHIEMAINHKTDICIFGDYDADGITSTAILWKTLSSMGCSVMPFIPHRQKHGYGLSKSALTEILDGTAFKSDFHPSMIITTDTGIVAHDEIDWLKKNNITVLLTDHHKSSETLPNADVVIHTTETSAAGIAFLISQYLIGQSAWQHIELATVGIIADQIPVTGINRDIIYHGLSQLQSPQNKGLQALYSTAGIDDTEITTYTVGFMIAPRINATGRLQHGITSLRLLCSNSLATANALAKEINSINKERQEKTNDTFKDALVNMERSSSINIIASDAYHEGLIGLIAGKLVEETKKPSIVISIDGECAKGSARSIKGIDITKLLRTQSDILESVGGHELAAGFSIQTKNIEKFKHNINEEISKLNIEQNIQEIVVDGILDFNQINIDLYKKISLLAPFGLGNPKPRFLSKDIKLTSSRRIGKNANHTKMTINQNNKMMEAIWFNAPTINNKQNITNIIYKINLNQWRNQKKLQLIIDYAE